LRREVDYLILTLQGRTENDTKHKYVKVIS